MNKISIKVKGMYCEGCAIAASNALKKKQGIVSAEVRFSDETANIEYDEEKISIEKVHSYIKDIGYEAISE